MDKQQVIDELREYVQFNSDKLTQYEIDTFTVMIDELDQSADYYTKYYKVNEICTMICNCINAVIFAIAYPILHYYDNKYGEFDKRRLSIANKIKDLAESR